MIQQLQNKFTQTMTVVFFSTNTNIYDGRMHFFNKPSARDFLSELMAAFPGTQFYVVTQRPGMFLADIDQNGNIIECPGIKYIVADNEDARTFAQRIVSLNPDTAVAASFWVTPFDWLGLSDALVAEYLEQAGIRTICNTSKTQYTCFDKNVTHDFLTANNFCTPRSIFVHRERFIAERGRAEIHTNAYREYIFSELDKLNYPVVIKDTSGLSSYGMEVVKSSKAARGFLCSKNCSCDKIVQEFIEGISFGTEIYGRNGDYEVMDPFMFSVNKYGLTSPKQSVKLGPVTAECFCTADMKRELKRLADVLCIDGIAQVDLIFNPEQKKWYIIEINPRLSGMTKSVAAANGFNFMAALYDKNTAFCRLNKKFVLTFKFPILDKRTLVQLCGFPGILSISQTVNDAAKQQRECGFCEVVTGGTDSIVELSECLEKIKDAFPKVMEDVFYEKAKEMLSLIKP